MDQETRRGTSSFKFFSQLTEISRIALSSLNINRDDLWALDNPLPPILEPQKCFSDPFDKFTKPANPRRVNMATPRRSSSVLTSRQVNSLSGNASKLRAVANRREVCRCRLCDKVIKDAKQDSVKMLQSIYLFPKNRKRTGVGFVFDFESRKTGRCRHVFVRSLYIVVLDILNVFGSSSSILI